MDPKWVKPTSWTGVVHTLKDSTAMGVAHGQHARVHGGSLFNEELYAIYNGEIDKDDGTNGWKLDITKAKCVLIPHAQEQDLTKVKDICAGIGGITQGLQFLGFESLASMDKQDLMIDTMKRNGMKNVIKGDVNDPEDRCILHQTPRAVRGLIASGFPCQPLSTQGDGRGHDDERAMAFDSVVKATWEQQSAGLLLENVPRAKDAPYVQDLIHKLAWSLGMEVTQTVLKLEVTWPNKRTRWWTLLLPREYGLRMIPDLPQDPPMQRLDSIFKTWPQWTDEEEDELALSEPELAKMHNDQYGKDVRILQNDQPCPCFLHSYSTGLEACPCGCRGQPFSEVRLARDGFRGFYVYSQRDGLPRWLHPREAAALVGVDPMMKFPDQPKAGLCLIGQAASAIQAAWMGAHALKALRQDQFDPEAAVTGMKMMLLRQTHGFLPSPLARSLTIHDPEEDTQIDVVIKGKVQVKDLRAAELRLQGEGHRIIVGDTMGTLTDEYQLTSGAIQGDITMVTQTKKQRLHRNFKVIEVEMVEANGDQRKVYCSSGTFLFEVVQRIHVDCSDTIFLNYDNCTIKLGDRIWDDCTIKLHEKGQIFAYGTSTQGGLGDRQLDRQAKRMIIVHEKEQAVRWMPTIEMTSLLHEGVTENNAQWLMEATTGRLAGCAAHGKHWTLLVIYLKEQTLYVEHWDGMNHECREDVIHMMLAIRAYINRKKHIRTHIVTFRQTFSQTYPHTCGTIALLHFGEILGLWNRLDAPDELHWHQILLTDPLPSQIYAKGWNDDDDELKESIRAILHEKGVSEAESEDRYQAAVKKIGYNKLASAMEAKNPWAALKAAGSHPKVNYLWVKPMELEKQIKQKAGQKYKVSAPNKKQGNRQNLTAVNMNPADLQLLPGTFVTEDKREVLQITMDEVATDRAGLAFSSLEEIAPYLKNDKSISMDALAVLTTAPVPPTEQGLMPITNLRFPACYRPTEEAVLIEGSLVQLGDCSIVRAPATAEAKIKPVETRTYKVSIWKDEWPGDWDQVATNPVKQLVAQCPRLLLCRGDRCGPGCKRHHAPVDSEVDNVIVDVWGRGFFTSRGKRVNATEADQFQVLLRIPVVCADGIQQRSGHDGIYFEPRQNDGKASCAGMEVIWLPGVSKPDASHKVKITDKGLALARFGNKYGIRTLAKDAEAVHQELMPETPYQNVHIDAVYEIRPLPHGIQKTGVLSLLRQWGWEARALQPSRGDQYGAGWLIGGKEPPSWVFQTNEGDVLVSTHKKAENEKKHVVVLGSQKTKSHMRQAKQPGQGGQAHPGKENIPFEGRDPWGGMNTYAKNQNQDVPMAVTSKLDLVQSKLQDSVRQEVQANLREENEERFLRLETGMTELKEQNRRFEGWFHEAGKVSAGLQHQVNAIAGQVQEQKKEIGNMGDKIDRGFANIEALLSKSRRTEDWRCNTGPCGSAHRAPGLRQSRIWATVLWAMLIIGSFSATSANPTQSCSNLEPLFLAGRNLSLGSTGEKKARLPVQNSIMDSFFQWQEARRDFAAAQQLQAQDPDDHEEAEALDLALDSEHGDLSVLEERGGDQRWRIYRPDPGRVGRRPMLEMMVDGRTDMRQIRRRMLDTWPDLMDLTIDWKIVTIHESVAKSTAVPDDVECFLVNADSDVPIDSTVTLNEYQRWRLQMKTFHTGLVAKVTRRQTDISSFLHFPDEQHRCFARPCVLRINDQIVAVPQVRGIGEGSFIVNADFDRTETIPSIVGSYHQDNYLEQIPSGYERLVGLQMGIRDNRRRADFHEEGRAMQRSLATLYHHLFVLWMGEFLRDRKILILGAPAHQRLDRPQSVQLLDFEMGDDPADGFPAVLEALVVEYMTEDQWSKQFIELHPSTKDMTFAKNQQMLAVRPLTIFQPKNMIIAEVMQIPRPPAHGGIDQVDQMIVFAFSPIDRSQMLQLVDLHQECDQDNCLVLVNGIHATETGERHLIPDGSTLRIFVWQAEQDEDISDTIPALKAAHDDDQSQEEDQVEQVKKRRRTESTMPPPGFVGHSVVFAIWAMKAIGCKIQEKTALSTRMRVAQKTGDRQNRLLMIFAVCMMCLPIVDTLHLQATLRLHRQGEATNPGPEFWLGTVNPTGIRGKEAILCDLPYGNWGITETHLSGANMRSSVSSLKYWAKDRGRNIQCIPGHALPLRARSHTVGTWAGVMTLTDLLPREIQISWPNKEYQLGRAQMMQTWIGPYSLTGAVVYGWAKSPTWPKALRDTNLLFDHLVQELVLSRGGPRYIMGDFNHDLEQLRGWEVMQQSGWRDSQDLANELWGQDYLHTCKGRTITDHILISPELISLLREVRTWDWFTDHSALGIRLEVPCWKKPQKVWTMPSTIDWNAVDKDSWKAHQHQLTGLDETDLDRRVSCFARDYEQSFSGHMTDKTKLPKRMQGRCQRQKPEIRPADLPLLRPSRPGEVAMSSESLGRNVQAWFRQLRRIQSLAHSVRANKQTMDAQLYRIELWSSIERARGFEGGFRTWWEDRPTKQAGLPPQLPRGVPNLAMVEGIFHDFEINYRRLESWHSRQRVKVLQAQYCQQTTKVFEIIRKEPKGGINYLKKKVTATVIGATEDCAEIQVDQQLPQDVPITIEMDHMTTTVRPTGNDTFTPDGEWLIQPGAEVDVVSHHVTPESIQGELKKFWKSKWWKETPPQPHEWDRILNFARAYMPPGHCEAQEITIENWMEVNKRYGPRAARGPDGIDREDLKHMPICFQEELTAILNECEEQCYWPKTWLRGFVHSLAKKEGAATANEFRPVIIYSMIYRSWSSLRAKMFLSHLNTMAGEHQLGFLPGHEPTELWLLTQGLLEMGMQQGEHYVGFVSDIKKAFESLPRQPLQWLANHLGLPKKAVSLWFKFLEETERYFVVQGQVSEPITSNSGYPEGCALSCTAMVMAGLSLHRYMEVFSRRALTLSFVDNLELIAKEVWDLQSAIICMQTWTDSWGLELDAAKSFTWATQPGQRSELDQLGWQKETSMKDLGAQMVYGAKKSIAAQKTRLDALNPLWSRLKRCIAPTWQKLRVVVAGFWPKAFYGISNCTLGWGHIKSLRTMMMRSFGWGKAGANAGIRLSILNDMKVDPGYFQAWEVINTFRRLASKQPGLVELWVSYMDYEVKSLVRQEHVNLAQN